MIGTVQNQDAYMQSVAAQRPFFFDHVAAITDQAMNEFFELTGRRTTASSTYRCDDAEYLILGQGSMLVTAEAVADYLRETRKHQSRRGQPDHVPSLPGRSAGQHPAADAKASRCWSASINRSPRISR